MHAGRPFSTLHAENPLVQTIFGSTSKKFLTSHSHIKTYEKLFVSPVPQQPFPQTEDCTIIYAISQNFLARAICSAIFT